MIFRREVLLVAVFTLLAAVLRLWNLDGAPHGLFGDAGHLPDGRGPVGLWPHSLAVFPPTRFLFFGY